MLTALEKKIVVLGLTATFGTFIFALSRMLVTAPAPRQVSVIANPFIKWNTTEKGVYSLTVPHNQQFIQGIDVPPVPGTGHVHIVAGKWTVKPEAYVEVTNLRSKETKVTTADRAGAFVVDTEADGGDTFNIFSIQQLHIQPPMQAMVAVQPAVPAAKR